MNNDEISIFTWIADFEYAFVAFYISNFTTYASKFLFERSARTI